MTDAATLTDALRTAAENLRDLGPDRISASDDPLTLVRNLRATVDAIADAMPGVFTAARFDQSYGPSDAEAVADFTTKIRDGLAVAASGLGDASNSI